ncbi:hypothetical protein CP973_24540 [Streptomyces albofaciens JCM 4342]|nr:hypothetical protein CP973_24540 [Streptomyces albofaciens JCM 4342]
MVLQLWSVRMTEAEPRPGSAGVGEPAVRRPEYFTTAPCPRCQTANDGLNGRFACDACGHAYSFLPSA